MRKIKENSYSTQQNQKQQVSLEDLNPSVVVLKYIQPARQLLQSNNLINSAYKKQFNYVPHALKCSDQFHPLAEQTNLQESFSYNPDLTVNIYKRDLSLKMNPFQVKNYFRSTNMDNRAKTKAENNGSDRSNLRFDSHFESGNLLSVEKELINERYHLMMQNDINTFGCTQWFFFRVRNNDPAQVTFLINNFYKTQSLYKNGMKILIFSMKRFINEGVGWIRGGDEIAYFPNRITEKKLGSTNFKQFYSLKFRYNFEYQDDQVYFAYNYPYTYSKLNQYIAEKQTHHNQYFKCRTLCKTAADNRLFLITITNSNVDNARKNSIFLTSRVHPGETVSSLMMEGIIDFLISDHQVARALRDRFIFKIVPMLNPDGVIHGNYRTNLAGLDLNRVWDAADKFLSPEIYELKKYITQYNKQFPIMMFCDLHGHSARKSAFIYGCQRDKLKLINVDQECRLFPFMLSCVNDDFLYQSCNFNVQKEKRGTARIQLWRELKIPNIFTLEASFCSSENSQYHFRPADYLQIGVSFCKTIHEYFLNANKKIEFYEKLKLMKDSTMNKESDGQETDSDTDLLDQKTINDLKGGLCAEDIWSRRTIVLQKPEQSSNPEQERKDKPVLRRRIAIDRNRKTAKTENSPDLYTSIIAMNSKKTIVTPIPTKRLTLDTDTIKYSQPKGCLKGSIFQRVEQNYRGKSTIYRIHKKNLNFRNISSMKNQSTNKGLSLFEMEFS